MSDLKKLGISFNIDEYERNLIFNINVAEASTEKFGNMDNIFEAMRDIKSTVWLAVQMFNEDAEIWNKKHPDDKKPLVDEMDVKRGVDGVGGIADLIRAVNAAIIKGLPEDQVKQVEEISKNLLAAQTKQQEQQRILNGAKMNRSQRRQKDKK
jgi:predicted RND superfamily exporter protein